MPVKKTTLAQSRTTYVRISRPVQRMLKIQAAQQEVSMSSLVNKAVCSFLGVDHESLKKTAA